jgi:hypothetical protein
MPNLELYMLGFIVLVAGTALAWFIYDARSEDEK